MPSITIPNLIVLPGPPGDLLTHYWQLSNVLPHAWYMRLTADCPLISSELIRESWHIFRRQPVPYWCNRRWYPDGFDVEIFSHSYLERAHVAVTDEKERNHCVAGAVANKFAEHFLSLDYEADLERIEKARTQIN